MPEPPQPGPEVPGDATVLQTHMALVMYYGLSAPGCRCLHTVPNPTSSGVLSVLAQHVMCLGGAGTGKSDLSLLLCVSGWGLLFLSLLMGPILVLSSFL